MWHSGTYGDQWLVPGNYVESQKKRLVVQWRSKNTRFNTCSSLRQEKNMGSLKKLEPMPTTLIKGLSSKDPWKKLKNNNSNNPQKPSNASKHQKLQQENTHTIKYINNTFEPKKHQTPKTLRQFMAHSRCNKASSQVHESNGTQSPQEGMKSLRGLSVPWGIGCFCFLFVYFFWWGGCCGGLLSFCGFFCIVFFHLWGVLFQVFGFVLRYAVLFCVGVFGLDLRGPFCTCYSNGLKMIWLESLFVCNVFVFGCLVSSNAKSFASMSSPALS